MQIQDLITLFRKQVSDLEAPYLWDDDEVLEYVVDAQDTFVRLIGGISDLGFNPETQVLTDLPLTAGNPITPLPDYVLHTRSGRLLGAKRNIDFVDPSDLGQYIRFNDYGNAATLYLDDTATGPVQCAIKADDTVVRWYMVPSEDDICRCHIYRLPYPRIEDQEDELEIQAMHHPHLVMWMKHRAYSKEDAETYDANLAALNKVAFEDYCAAAKLEAERRRGKSGHFVKADW